MNWEKPNKTFSGSPVGLGIRISSSKPLWTLYNISLSAVVEALDIPSHDRLFFFY